MAKRDNPITVIVMPVSAICYGSPKPIRLQQGGPSLDLTERHRMQLAYASDLHFEFHRDEANWLPPLPDSADVLILAGDIDVGIEAIDSVQRIAEAMPDTDVIYVAGNHEFYHHNHEKLLDSYRTAFAKLPRVHFLENSKIELHGYVFLGCTLWSGFDAFPEFSQRQSMAVAARHIPDFRLIRTNLNDGHTESMTATRMHHLYKQSRRWLSRELSQSAPQSTVVISHFPPHPSLRHGNIPHGILSNYFTADCRDLINEHQPALWVYGHNHWSDRLNAGPTLLISNQLGYPQEQGEIRDYIPQTLTF